MLLLLQRKALTVICPILVIPHSDWNVQLNLQLSMLKPTQIILQSSISVKKKQSSSKKNSIDSIFILLQNPIDYQRPKQIHALFAPLHNKHDTCFSKTAVQLAISGGFSFQQDRTQTQLTPFNHNMRMQFACLLCKQKYLVSDTTLEVLLLEAIRIKQTRLSLLIILLVHFAHSI